MMEHRQRKRHRAFTLAEVKGHKKHCMTGLVYNVSRDGIFILTTIAPKVDRIVNISISIPETEMVLVPISGIVVHRSSNGFGLMFCEERETTWQLVDKLLRRYMELTLAI